MKNKAYSLLVLLIIVFTVLFMPDSLTNNLGLSINTKASVTLDNPIIEKKPSMISGQKVTYDCVWFGSYPQTEIVGQPSDSGVYGKDWETDSDFEINPDLYNQLSSSSADWDSNGDITYDGIKYHRIKKADAIYSVLDSNHYNWNDSDSYHYFRYEKIKWRVLNVEDRKAFLLADLSVDVRPFSLSGKSVSWETSLPRAWLNDYFFYTAFSTSEQNSIITTTIKNEDNPIYSTEGGENTSDRIFLLSFSEISSDQSVSYGFTSKNSSDESRISYSSTYAKAMGLGAGTIRGTNLRRVSWWLRSPGEKQSMPSIIGWFGDVGSNGYTVNAGMRPSLFLNLTSTDNYEYAGTVSTDETKNEITYGSKNSNGTTFTISYDANGGTNAPDTQTKIKGTDLVLSSEIPERNGYTFLGWALSKAATNSKFSPGKTYSYDSDITFYAVWRKIITLSYDTNGGSEGPTSESAILYNSDTSYTFNISHKIPVKNGSTFIGWGTTSSTASYTSGDKITLTSGATLYAIWDSDSAETYMVTYNANGGQGIPASQQKTKGVPLTLSSTKPSRSGYEFIGWGTGNSNTVATYSSGGLYDKDRSVILYAIWKKTITITFNAYGGDNAPETKTATVYNSVASYDFTIPEQIPTRDKYEFLGWGIYEGTTTESYSPGETYSFDKSITLYAIWRTNLNLTYDANGGTEISYGSYGVIYNMETSRTYTITSKIPYRNGYSFLGWSDSSSAVEASYFAGDEITISKDTILYAVWEALPYETYLVQFYANGGINPPESQTKIKGTDLVITSIKPTRSGYTFVGWGTSSSSKNPLYTPGGIYTEDSEITLYAIWKKTIVLTYDANGGQNGPPSENIDLFNSDTFYSYTISLSNPSREGYKFLGWSASKNATSASYIGGDIMSLSSSTTLYAVWESKSLSTYNVAFDANGGSGAPGTQIKTEGIGLTISTIEPSRDDYEFMGWGISSSSTAVKFDPGATYGEDKDITLYAIWRREIKLTFDPNGGMIGNAYSSTSIKYLYNDESDKTFTISSYDTPNRDGYTFIGWNIDQNATTASYLIGSSITISKNTTLYAVWKDTSLETYMVTYLANGGSGAPEEQTKTKGQALILSTSVPERNGYDFLGWGTSSSSTEILYNAGDTYSIDADITLYAIWGLKHSEDERVTLIYSGLTGGENIPASITVMRGTIVNLSGLQPTMEGFDFLGWNEDANATSANYAPKDQIELSRDITLYAIWKKIQDKEIPSYIKPTIKKEQIITASNRSFAIKSGPVSLGAKTNGNGKLTYISSNKTVADISSTGVVTPKNYGETIITIQASETSNSKVAVKRIVIRVVPKKMIFKSVKAAANRAVSLKWKKDKTVSGYQIQICRRKDFKSGAYQRTCKPSAFKKRITNLKKKTWYVRIRSFKKIGKSTYYGIWSAVKKVKIK